MDLSRLQLALLTELVASCSASERMTKVNCMLNEFWDIDYDELRAIRSIEDLSVESRSLLCASMNIDADDLAVFLRVLRALTNK